MEGWITGQNFEKKRRGVSVTTMGGGRGDKARKKVIIARPRSL